MLKLNSVTFKDEETGKVIEIFLKDNHFVANTPITAEDYFVCCFHKGLLLNGGIESAKSFVKQD